MNAFRKCHSLSILLLILGLWNVQAPIALAQGATAQASGATYEKVRSLEGITEFQLSNGVRFLLFPDPASSTITINMTVLVGSRHEGYGETGMAHLLEHMLFKGSKEFPELDKALQAHGAESNASTWVDRTNYYETMPAKDKNLEFAIKMEADRLVNSFIRREDLAKEMTVVRSEFEQGENSPTAILNQRMMAAAYEWHNYGKSTIGNRSDIERVPIENLQQFYKKHYRPDNIVLVVAGKFEEKRALDLIVQCFGALKTPGARLQDTYTEEPAQDGERSVILRRVGKISVVGLMYHIPAAGHDDLPALDVLSSILGESPSGRLYKELVETKKAAKVSCGITGWHDPGILEATAQVADGVRPEEVRDIMIRVLEDFNKNPATKKEVERAVTSFLAERERTLAKSKLVAMELTEWIAAGDWRLLYWHRDKVAKVTPEEVDKVAAKYLKESNRTVGMFIPTKEVARVTVPDRPDVTAMLKDYKGGKSVSEGEAFDPTPANIENRVKRLELSNGVKVALLPKKTRGETVVGRLSVHFGNEKSLGDYRNASAFLGSLMMRGTKKHTRQEIQDLLDNMKSKINAGSGLGSLAFSWETKKEQLPQVLSLLKEIVREPSFPEKEFNELKVNQKQSLEKALTDPGALAFRALQRHLNPHAKDDIRYVPTIPESIERLGKLKLEDVARLYSEQVGAKKGEIVLVGDFDPDQVIPQLEALVADWKSKTPYERITHAANTKVKGVTESILTPDKEGATYAAGLAFALNDTAPEYPALSMGNYILGGSSTSRLWDRLRQKDGYCYNVDSEVSVDSQDPYSLFYMSAICNPENIDKVDQGALQELKKIIKDGVSASELDDAKKGLLQELAVARSSDGAVTGMLLNGLYLNRTMKHQADLEKKIADLSVADVNRALATFLSPDRLVVIRAGDFNKKAGGAKK